MGATRAGTTATRFARSTDIATGPTVLDITAGIDTGTVAVYQPTLAAQPIGAVT